MGVTASLKTMRIWWWLGWLLLLQPQPPYPPKELRKKASGFPFKKDLGHIRVSKNNHISRSGGSTRSYGGLGAVDDQPQQQLMPLSEQGTPAKCIIIPFSKEQPAGYFQLHGISAIANWLRTLPPSNRITRGREQIETQPLRQRNVCMGRQLSDLGFLWQPLTY